MRKLSERHGFPTVVRNLRFISIRLGSRPETAVLAKEVDEVRTSLQSVAEIFAQALEERVAATAEIEYLDRCLDDAVMDLARETSVMSKGQITDPWHTKLFPAAPSELIRPIAGEEQGRFIRSLVNRLREDKDYGHLLRHAEAIEQAQLAVNAAVEQRQTLFAPELKAQTDRRIALDRARALYNALYHRLTLLYPKDPGLVRSFFVRPDVFRGREELGAESGDATSGAGESSGALE